MARGKGETTAVDGGLFEEQRLAAAGRFHLAIGDFGDFQFGGDGLGDALQFARRVRARSENHERNRKPCAKPYLNTFTGPMP